MGRYKSYTSILIELSGVIITVKLPTEIRAFVLCVMLQYETVNYILSISSSLSAVYTLSKLSDITV